MVKGNTIRDIVLEHNNKALLLPAEFDSALVGTAQAVDSEYVACYSSDECIKILIKKQNLDEIEALEYFQQTTVGGKYNKNKPIFIADWRKTKEITDKEIEEIEKVLKENPGKVFEVPVKEIKRGFQGKPKTIKEDKKE
jgi:ribosomal protein L29